LQETERKTSFFFVDESGDPNFYGKGGNIIVGESGCSRILLLGFVQVENPEPIRNALRDLREQISTDKYELICDVFDKPNYKGGGNFYDRNRNPLEIKKASPLG